MPAASSLPRFRGDGLSLTILVTTNGNTQSVVITSANTDIAEVAIKLSKNR